MTALIAAPMLALNKDQVIMPSRLHEADELGWIDHGVQVPVNPPHYGWAYLKTRDESDFFNPLFKGNKKALQLLTTKVHNTVHEYWVHRRTGKTMSSDAYFDKLFHPYKFMMVRPNPMLKDWVRRCSLVRFMSIEFEFTDPQSYLVNKAKAMKLLANAFDVLVAKDHVHIGCLAPCSSLTLMSFDGTQREMLFLYPVGTDSLTELLPHNKFFVSEGHLPAIVVKLDGRVDLSGDPYYRGDEPGLQKLRKVRLQLDREVKKWTA